MTPTDQAALNYLTEFLKRNPQILEAAYGGEDSKPEEVEELQAYSEDPANWNMRGPRPPIMDDYFIKRAIGVYDEGVDPGPFAEATNTVSARKVALMRYFYHQDMLSDCGFNLLEMKDGSFRMGTLADNWPE